MSHTRRPVATLIIHTLSLFISYTLIVALFAPFAARRAEAAPATAPTVPTASNTNNSTTSRAQEQAQEQKGARRDGELLVRFRDGVGEQKRDEIARERGARRGRKLKSGAAIERLELQGADDPALAAQALLLHPEVELAEPNYLIERADITPNDALR